MSMTKRKDIPGYKGRYAVDTEGNVYSYRSGRNLKPQKQWAGYRLVSLGKNRSFAVHRLVAKAWLKQPSDKHEVNHKNGIKHDNRVSNLEWVTKSENLKHARQTGLNPIRYGEDTSAAKLTNNQVVNIRHLHASGFTQTRLAIMYGVTQSNISRVVNGNRRRVA